MARDPHSATRTRTVLPGDLPRILDSGSLEPRQLFGGRYEVLELLGSGGYGTVHRVRDRQLEGDPSSSEASVDIALKILDRVRVEDPRYLRREVLPALRVDSPHVVRVFHFETESETLYLLMELAPHGSLRDRLFEGPMSLQQAVDTMTQVLQGLHDLHSCGFVHRDLKPSNILQFESRVKISDLGLAEAVETTLPRKTGGGTRGYQAPELTDQPATFASDLYSAGCLFYELLTGDLPPGPTEGALGKSFLPSISRPLAAIVHRLLQAAPADRFAGAEEVLEVLRRWQRNRGRRLASALGLLLILLLSGAGFWWSERARNAIYSHFEVEPGVGVKVLDSTGEVLWERASESVVIEEVQIAADELPQLAAIFYDQKFQVEDTQRLQFLEPSSGRVLRTVNLDMIRTHQFISDYSPLYEPRLQRLDLDGDGGQELLISFRHRPYWPFFLYLYEPKIGRLRLLLVASGYHTVGAAVDLDGDGQRELLCLGNNNLMGFNNAVLALRFEPAVNEDPEREGFSTVSTPDYHYTEHGAHNRLWYTLVPKGVNVTFGARVEVDRERRVLVLPRDDGSLFEVSFDGRLVSQAGPPPEEAIRNQKLAYQNLREARRLMDQKDPTAAAESLRPLLQSSVSIGNPILTEWIGRFYAQALIAAGEVNAGEEVYRRLNSRTEVKNELAFELAYSFHLAGEVERAVGWYRQSLGIGMDVYYGRGTWEYLEGLVLSLGELGRWSEAATEVERFGRVRPNSATVVTHYREYVRWQRGDRPRRIGSMLSPSTQDLPMYWNLEFRRAGGEEAADLLPAVDEELFATSESRPMVRSLRAEILGALGQIEEALLEAELAVEEAQRQRTRNTAVRAHFGLVEARLKSLQSLQLEQSASEQLEPPADSTSEELTVRVDAPRRRVEVFKAGQKLWALEDFEGHATPVKFRGSESDVAAVFAQEIRGIPVVPGVFAVYDGVSGSVLQSFPLDATGFEPFAALGFTPRFGPRLEAFDVGGDGRDELLVSFFHTYWPSSTLMIDPYLGEDFTLLLATGHHRPVAVLDIDKDGRIEMLFVGTNNELGYSTAVGCIVLPDRTQSTIDWWPASTPDHNYYPRPARDPLKWYTLLPSEAGDSWGSVDLIDHEGDNYVRVRNRTGSDHFLLDSVGRRVKGLRPLAAVDRNQIASFQRARQEIYRRYRRANELIRLGRLSEASQELANAVQLAPMAQDQALGDWLVVAVELARIGTEEEAQAENRLLTLFRDRLEEERLELAKELGFRTGRTYHRRSRLDSAVRWYELVLEAGAPEIIGRSHWEAVQKIVIANMELGRWQAALDAIDRYGPRMRDQQRPFEVYADYVRLRSGEGVTRPPRLMIRERDLVHYWALEIRFAQGDSPEVLLAEIDSELSKASENTAALHSLRAEALAKMGRVEEARNAAEEALLSLDGWQADSILTTFHKPVVEERAERLGI